MELTYHLDWRKKDRTMRDGSIDSLTKSLEKIKDHVNLYEIHVQYRNLTFWNAVPLKGIPTVGSALRSLLLLGATPKRRVDIFRDLTGLFKSNAMTLLMGPPGSGKFPKYALNLLFVNNMCVICALSNLSSQENPRS